MTANQFRRIALGHEGVIESAHMNHPDFRFNNKIFATLTEDETRGMVAVTPEQQEQLLADHPKMFTPAAGAWGRQGCTMVVLREADAEVVGEAMTMAWQKVKNAPLKAAKKAKKRR